MSKMRPKRILNTSELMTEMNVKWQKVKLCDLCSSISDGDHLAPPKSDTGVPFVTISDIRDNHFDLSDTRFVPEAYYQKIDEKRKVHKGDVLYSVVGSYGIPVFAASDLKIAFQRHIAILRPGEKLVPKFLYYSLKNPTFYKKADGAAIGAAQKTISLSALRRLEIDIPPLPTQKRIADILSAYDDLIENNRRRMEILEESARLIYRKLFGGKKANGAMVDIAEVCDTIGGGTPNTSIREYWEGGTIPWVVPTDVTRNTSLILLDTERKITQKGLESSSSRMLPTQSILMTSRASVGYFAIANFPVCTNQGFISIVPHEENMRYYLLHNLMERVEEIRSNAKGSTFPEISKTRFRSLKIKVPSQDALNDFQMIVEPIYEQVQTLAGAMRKLAEARDMLLPKLMSGEFGGEKNKVCL